MSISLWRGGDAFKSEASSSVECLKTDEMQLVLYTLKNKESVNIVPDDFEETITIVVMSGGIKLLSASDTLVLDAHDIIMLTNIDQSYYMEAVGLTKVLITTSKPSQDVAEDEAIVNMLNEVEHKDVYTLGHSRRVSLYAKRLALAYETTYNVIALSAAACMHDVGKINTPIEILQKPARLTKEEFDIVKRHPVDSYNILMDVFGERVARAAGQHHERLDGSGYPDGLKGDQICMDARILAVADVFDAMTCRRIYNEPLAPIEVVKMLEENLDKYDATIVSILRRKVLSGEIDEIMTYFVSEDE